MVGDKVTATINFLNFIYTEHRPEQNWPADGKIEFKDVYLRYDIGNDPILKGLNINIASGEKVEIVKERSASIDL